MINLILCDLDSCEARNLDLNLRHIFMVIVNNSYKERKTVSAERGHSYKSCPYFHCTAFSCFVAKQDPTTLFISAVKQIGTAFAVLRPCIFC